MKLGRAPATISTSSTVGRYQCPISDDGHAAVVALRDAGVERGRAQARILAAVTRARGAGVSWSVLATVLGTSRQAVQQRYGAQIAEDPNA